MGKLKMTAKVVSQETLATDVYSLVLEAPEIASQAIAGQLVSNFRQTLQGHAEVQEVSPGKEASFHQAGMLFLKV